MEQNVGCDASLSGIPPQVPLRARAGTPCMVAVLFRNSACGGYMRLQQQPQRKTKRGNGKTCGISASHGSTVCTGHFCRPLPYTCCIGPSLLDRERRTEFHHVRVVGRRHAAEAEYLSSGQSQHGCRATEKPPLHLAEPSRSHPCKQKYMYMYLHVYYMYIV